MKIKDDDILHITIVRIEIEKCGYILTQILDRYQVVYGMNTDEIESLIKVVIDLETSRETLNELIKKNYS
jgi:hypothetical protein